jgi:hypothetical protein
LKGGIVPFHKARGTKFISFPFSFSFLFPTVLSFPSDLFVGLDLIKMSFDSIPILDLSLAKQSATKPQFLEQLRHALLEVGFLYLKNVGIPEELTQRVIDEGVKFFDLPMEEK